MLGKLVATHIRVHERVAGQPASAPPEQSRTDTGSSEEASHVEDSSIRGTDPSRKPS